MGKVPVSADELVELVKLAIRNGTTHALPDLVGEWAHEAEKTVIRLRNELHTVAEIERKRCAAIARRMANKNLATPGIRWGSTGWDVADEIEKGNADA